jgi:hypothetical protein
MVRSKPVLLRDHVILFASEFEKVDAWDPSVRRDILRWYRLFTNFVDLINKELTGLASLMQTSNTVQEWIYVYMHGEYYRVRAYCLVRWPALSSLRPTDPPQVNLVSPFIDYCYFYVDINPQDTAQSASRWGEEHDCALERLGIKGARTRPDGAAPDKHAAAVQPTWTQWGTQWAQRARAVAGHLTNPRSVLFALEGLLLDDRLFWALVAVYLSLRLLAP